MIFHILGEGTGKCRSRRTFLRNVLSPSPHIRFHGTEKNQAQKWALHADKSPFPQLMNWSTTLRLQLLVVPCKPFQTWSRLTKIPAALIRRLSLLEIAEIPKRKICPWATRKCKLGLIYNILSVEHTWSQRDSFTKKALGQQWPGYPTLAKAFHQQERRNPAKKTKKRASYLLQYFTSAFHQEGDHPILIHLLSTTQCYAGLWSWSQPGR